ncbi:MAG: lysine transporter LysE [Hyphomicrobiales bacterium]|nr:MAG: lysine transporter LysE [Hyphomicrobiales bacterium]
MSFEVWVAFAAACAVLTLIPGPCVLLLIGQSLSRGLGPAFSSIVGVLIGDILLIILSLMGVGAILAASAALFQLVKWAGVFYMAYLGICQILDARQEAKTVSSENHPAFMFGSLRAGFLAAVLNPKGVMFYMAFLSQFVNPNGNMVLQISILAITSTVVVGLILAAYVMMANKARTAFQSEKTRKRIGYTGGGFLIGGSVLMATTR